MHAEGRDVDEVRRAALEAQRQAGWADAGSVPEDRPAVAPDRVPGPGADAPATEQRGGGDNRRPPGEPEA